MANDEKVTLLSNALERTDAILDMFYDVVTAGHCTDKHEVRSFDKTAKAILNPDNRDNGCVIQEKVFTEEDIRFSLPFDRLKEEALKCSRCRLCEKRKNVVFGEGVMNPVVFVVGEGPGETEDDTGRPFVGKAGEFLDAWLKAISLDRTVNCYISNIVKCRPPMNRDPQLDEREICKPFLDQQISLLKPKAVLCIGKSASSIMTGRPDASMASLRGKFSLYRSDIPMLCTYHPAAVLRDMSLKRPVWDDLQKLAAFLGLETARKK